MVTITADAPSRIIRWHYLYYVGLALVVMVAAIASHDRWFLNFVHVMCGVLWTGIDLFMGFIVGPILRRIPLAARREVITRLVPRTLFLMPTLSIITGDHGLVPGQGPWLYRTRLAGIWLDRGRAGPRRH